MATLRIMSISIFKIFFFNLEKSKIHSYYFTEDDFSPIYTNLDKFENFSFRFSLLSTLERRFRSTKKISFSNLSELVWLGLSTNRMYDARAIIARDVARAFLVT